MKIANIVCTYPPYKGGIGTAAKEFADLMEEKGHKVVTFTADYGDKIDKEEDVVRLKTLIKYGNGAFLPQFFWCLKDFDIIYLNYPFFGVQEVLWFLLKFIYPKKKFIIRYHMDVVDSSFLTKILSILTKIIFSSLFKRADIIITASLDYIENSNLKNFYNKNKNKFFEVPYGVNIEEFKFEEKKETDIFNILFVGGLDQAHYFKGVDNLIKAVEILDKEKPNWHLSIVGRGNLKEEYEKKAKDLGLVEKIHFLDEVENDELPARYREANVLVLPSTNKCEAFGIVLIEAMSSGTPVIASNLPGVRSVFENNKQGLIIEPGNVSDIVEKIKYLMNNKEAREEMQKQARKLAEEKYDFNKIGDSLENILKNL